MAEKNIESFVSKLQAEGVEAGEARARQITEDAEKKSKQIISDAEKKAGKIIENAEKKASDIKNRAQTEMELASRDTLARLRDTLTAAMNNIVASKTGKALKDENFLKTVITEVVRQYVTADKKKITPVEINLNDDMRRQLETWILHELAEAVGRDKKSVPVNLESSLASAGFEYTVSGGTVEITVDSLAETISEMLSPAVVEAIKTSGGDSQ